MSTGSLTAISVVFSLLAAQALADPLRTVQDPQRNRTWRLESDAVYLQEGLAKRRIELPGWLYVGEGYASKPDLAIDAQGTAVVTSNVAPVVWRIDPRSAVATRHELVLDADKDKDVGFTGLAYAADQNVFFAVSATYGTLWRIDPLLRRAQHIPTSEPLRNPSGLVVERAKARYIVVLCVRESRESRRVRLAPDQRFAYVRHESCAEPAADANIALIQ